MCEGGISCLREGEWGMWEGMEGQNKACENRTDLKDRMGCVFT